VNGIESAGSSHVVARKLVEIVQLSAAAGDRIKSANAAIAAAKVKRTAGLSAWSELLANGTITKHPSGGFHAA
jgi:hypothetical protein